MKLYWEPIASGLKTTFCVAHRAGDWRLKMLIHLGDGVGKVSAVRRTVRRRKELSAA